jgi:DNA-binding Lrp family transcriptional regulator
VQGTYYGTTAIMVTAIVLINTAYGSTNSAAASLADLPGISEVYSVGGSFDVVAIVRVSSNEEIAELVTQRIVEVDGIVNTETMIAFEAYSRHDLERVFSIGME